jgi:hypothetical protein
VLKIWIYWFFFVLRKLFFVLSGEEAALSAQAKSLSAQKSTGAVVQPITGATTK